MTLTEFLLARIAEDEAYAHEPSGWNEYDPGDPINPARILAECEAKRQIIARHIAAGRVFRAAPGEGNGAGMYVMIKVCQMLTLPYADHPDFEEEWKP